MSLSFSACGYQIAFDDPEGTCSMLGEAGFDGIEANDRITGERSLEEIKTIGRIAASAGVPITTYHLPFSREHDVAGFYETDRVEAVRRIEAAMRRAHAMGATTAILHPTTSSYDVGIEGTNYYQQQMCRSLKQLTRTAEELEITIAVENMMNHDHRCYFSRPDHIESFRGAFEHPLVGFCLDTGHALITMGPEHQLEVMDAMGDRIVAYHLQDTPGDRDIHIAPGRGNVDFAGVFSRAAAHGFDRPMCIECAPYVPERPYTHDAWATLVADTRSLAEPA